MLAKILAIIVWLCDQCFWTLRFGTAAIPFKFQLFTAVSLIYSMIQLEAHQAAVLRKFKQWQWVHIHLLEIIGFVFQSSALLKTGCARQRVSDCLWPRALTCKLLPKHKYLYEILDYSMSAGDGHMWSILHSCEVHCSVVHPSAILRSDLQCTDCSNTRHWLQ